MKNPSLSPAERGDNHPQSAIKTPLRVLLVEDCEDDARLMLRALEKGGYDVTHARVETEEQMRAALLPSPVAEPGDGGGVGGGGWDVVIADYKLPRFDGMRALKLLQASGADIPFLLVSGTVTDATAIEIVKAGARDYIRKDQMGRLVGARRRRLSRQKTPAPGGCLVSGRG